MNKFYMLLLSATICATSPTFAMLPDSLTLEEYNRLSPRSKAMLQDELGHPAACEKTYSHDKAQTNSSSAFPSEFFSPRPVVQAQEEPSFSRFPKPTIIRASEEDCARFAAILQERQKQAQLPAECGYGQPEEPQQTSLPAAYVTVLPPEPEVNAQLEARKGLPSEFFNFNTPAEENAQKPAAIAKNVSGEVRPTEYTSGS